MHLSPTQSFYLNKTGCGPENCSEDVVQLVYHLSQGLAAPLLSNDIFQSHTGRQAFVHLGETTKRSNLLLILE